MAENDLFVDEVSEDVRRDRAYKQFHKFRFIIAAIIIGVIAFVSWNEFRKTRLNKHGEASYLAINMLSLVKEGEEGAAIAELEALENSNELSDWVLAGLYKRSGDVENAKRGYLKIAESGSYPEAFREMARLELYAIDENAEIGALANPNALYRDPAKLIEIDRLLEKGDKDEALQSLSEELKTVDSAYRAVIESLIIALGGELPDEESQ